MAYLTLDYKSMALMRSVNMRIYLPTDGIGGTVAAPPYKTLYFLNGFSSSSLEMMTYLGFRRQCELKGIAAVFPNGENSFYVDHPERGTNYATYIGKEIVEITRKLFPLSARREDTFLGGISMGGYGALRNGAVFSDTFGKVAAMSPAVDIYEVYHTVPDSGFSQMMLDHLFGGEEQFKQSDLSPDYSFLRSGRPDSSLPEVFLCCGRQDPLVYKQCKEFAAALDKTEITHIYRETDGRHEMDFWESMMDPMFSFLAGIPEGTENEVAG